MVLDAADDGALDHIENHDLGVRVRGAILSLKANVLKILGVPKGLEIAAQRIFVVRIARPGENSRLQGLGADAAISLELDALDRRRILLRGGRGKIHLRVGSSRIHLRFRSRRSHGRAGIDLGPQGQRQREQTEHQRQQHRNVNVRKQAEIFMCGRGKCQGRSPQAKIVRSPAGPARDGLRA